MPGKPPAEKDEGEEDGEGVDQVEVNRLAGVRVGQPPNCPVQIEVLEAQRCRRVEEDDDLEGEGGVVGDVRDGDGLRVGECTFFLHQHKLFTVDLPESMYTSICPISIIYRSDVYLLSFLTRLNLF